VQQISAALIIILKRRTRPIKRALIITAKTVLVTIIRIITIKRILVALKHKEGNKNRYYKLYQQRDP
jgi:hypothetical protein